MFLGWTIWKSGMRRNSVIMSLCILYSHFPAAKIQKQLAYTPWIFSLLGGTLLFLKDSASKEMHWSWNWKQEHVWNIGETINNWHYIETMNPSQPSKFNDKLLPVCYGLGGHHFYLNVTDQIRSCTNTYQTTTLPPRILLCNLWLSS